MNLERKFPEKFNYDMIEKVLKMETPDKYKFNMKACYVDEGNNTACFGGVIRLNFGGEAEQDIFNGHSEGAYGLFGVVWRRFGNTLEHAKARLLYTLDTGEDFGYKIDLTQEDYDEQIEPYLQQLKTL